MYIMGLLQGYGLSYSMRHYNVPDMKDQPLNVSEPLTTQDPKLQTLYIFLKSSGTVLRGLRTFINFIYSYLRCYF